MGWLTTAPTNWTTDSIEYIPIRAMFSTDTGWVAKIMIMTVLRKHKTGMTQAAAESEATTYKTANPTSAVAVEQFSVSGGYRVVVHDAARGTWGDET